MRTHDYFSLSKASSWAKLRGQRSGLLFASLLLTMSSLLMGSTAWAIGLEVQVNGDKTAAVPVTVTLTATPVFTANGINTTTCTTAAVPTAAGSYSCFNSTASGSVVLKVAAVPANYAVIWTGACSALTPTVTAGATTTSQVTVSVPASGGSITCAANITTINLFEVNPAAPASGLPTTNAVPLGPTSCINFGYVTSGSTSITKPVVATEVAAMATPSAITSVSILPYPQEFTVGTSPTTNPFVGTYTAAALTIPAAATTYQLTTVPAGPLPSVNLIFDPSKVTATTFPTTVTGKSFSVISNDPAVNNFNVPLVATVVQTTNPKLQVADASGNSIGNGTTIPIDLGTTSVGTPLSKTFTVKNVGYSSLTLTTPFNINPTGVVTSNPFALNQPTTTTLSFPAAPGCPGQTAAATTTPTSTTFDVVFSSSAAITSKTTYTGTVQLVSNDNGVANSTFTFPVTATVLPPPPSKPELQVLDEKGNVLYSTTTTGTQPGMTTPFDFGSTPAGTAVTKKFTFKNPSTALLTLSSPVFVAVPDPTKPSAFNITGIYPTSINPQSSSDVTVIFSSTVTGASNATFQIFSNDDDNSNVIKGDGKETPYTIPLTGTVTTGTTIPPGQSSLKVTVVGTGSISGSTPTGISSCTSAGEATCTANFVPGTVSLTATGGTVVWSGGCTGSGSTGTVNVVLNTPATCTATFTGTPTTGQSKLTVAVTGNGSIASSTPTGISGCTSANEPTCAANFAAGNVTLVANPTTGITWGSTCPNGTVTMNGTNPVTCAVTFTATPPPVTQSALTITVVGAGSVSAPNTGLTNCTSTGGANCKANFDAGTVTMMATVPTGGSVTWGNGCSVGSSPNIGTVNVVVGTPATCTATFASAPTGTALDVTVVGTGSISSSTPVGISNCTSAKEPTCTANFPAGAVTLTASPPTGATVAWSNGCAAGTAANTGTLTIVAGTPATCTATFTTPQPTTGDFTLKVVGTGSVTSSPAGISDCTSAAPCNTKFPAGNVTLTAKPANTIDTVAWTGDCTGTGMMSTVTIVANTPAVCVATFTAGTPPPTGTELSVTVVGSGSVTSNPAGINACSSAVSPCKYSFAAGNVTLTATPTNAADTVAWSAGCTGTGNTATLNIVAGTPATCTATITAATPPPVTTTDLTVTVVGNGSITSTPTGITCTSAKEPTCTAKFPAGVVTLAATLANPTDTVAWSAGCTGTGNTGTVTIVAGTPGTCTATLSSASTAKAQLTVTVKGNGTVNKQPAGGSCDTPSADCSTYTVGNTVALNAVASSGANFDSWAGDCSASGKNTLIQIKMDSAKSCTANFVASVTNQTLTLTKAGSGTGTVTSDGNEINCGTTCTATVPQGNTLKLTATANTDSTFAGWGGDCSAFANGNPAAVMMGAAKSCTATFNLKTQEATCFSQGGLLTADGKCTPATSLTVESTTGTTASVVEGGASKNGSSGYGPYNSSSSIMVLLDLIKTAVALKIDPADKGQKADLLAAGLYVFANTTPPTPVWYMLVGCSTCPLGWNVGVKPLATGTDALPILTALEAYKPGVTLDSDYLTIPLYEGSLPEMGTLDIYAGYRITGSGKLVFNTTPIHLNIVPRP